MKLLYSTHSPFARKTLVVAHELGLVDRIEVVHHEVSPTNRNEVVYSVNPLGLVPVLVLENDSALFDSNVICEYLQELQGNSPSVFPTDKEKRYLALRNQAIASGLCEAGIALRWETDRRPEQYRYPAFRDGQKGKLVSSIEYLENNINFDSENNCIDIGQIALAVALDWLEFRQLASFRISCPKLSNWLDSIKLRPSMLETPMKGETID
jgi:glutathione S-transferase